MSVSPRVDTPLNKVIHERMEPLSGEIAHGHVTI